MLGSAERVGAATTAGAGGGGAGCGGGAAATGGGSGAGGGGGGAGGALVIAARVIGGTESVVATAGVAANGAAVCGDAESDCGPDAGAGVTFVAPSGLPGSAAAGLPGMPVAGPSLRSGLAASFSLALASFSAASRSRRASRALASRSADSLSAFSRCAFCPPVPLTREPICGSCPRVSSAAEMPCSYCWPLAAGNALLAWIWRSAPGRSLALPAGGPPPNQPQPVSSAKLDTPSKPSQLLPVLSCPLRIAAYPCSKPSRRCCLPDAESKIDPSVVAAYLERCWQPGTIDTRYGTGTLKVSQETLQSQ